MQFHRTSAGYTGPDPADPIDPTEKGQTWSTVFNDSVAHFFNRTSLGLSVSSSFRWIYQVTQKVYSASIPDATQSDVTGRQIIAGFDVPLLTYYRSQVVQNI